jgi:hypothetical protein
MTGKMISRNKEEKDENKEEFKAYAKTDKELTDIIFLAGSVTTTTSNITEQVKKAYELGFKRGFKAAKQEDMPWFCWDSSEKDKKKNDE